MSRRKIQMTGMIPTVIFPAETMTLIFFYPGNTIVNIGDIGINGLFGDIEKSG